MRVRRASTRARRPSASVPSLAAAAAIALFAASPDAVADGAAPSQHHSNSATGTATKAGAGVRVADIAIPAASAAEAGRLGKRPVGAPAGALVAHVRRAQLSPFSMVGVTWRHSAATGPVTIEVRTRSADAWTRWTGLETDSDGGPLTTANDASFRDGTEADWVGQATGVEVAVYGLAAAPDDLKVSLIDPGRSTYDVAAHDAKAGQVTGKGGSFPRMPKIITRKQWGADESLGDRCWDPRYGRTFKAVIVHHTAGSNDYTERESAAIVRGIYAYHTQSRGWCDIGYNFLIDRFGNVFEGRDGGIRRPVRGAHAGDYNVNTTGASLMGNFDTAYPTAAMKHSLVSLIAWRLGTAYHHAYGKPFVYDRRISRISGHRDVMATACPGQNVYDWLPALRRRVNARLGDWSSRIERRWERIGGKTSDLGPVRIGERGGDGGRWTVFAGGRMYAGGHGVHTLYKGPILDRYLAWDETAGDLGYPRTDALAAGDGRGLRVEFDGGWVYWSKRTGAEALRRGDILRKYLALNGAASRLGFPRSEVLDRDAFAVAHFQGGSIRFDRKTHKTSVEYR